jgi:cyclohexanecarboxylate-CoA ligase
MRVSPAGDGLTGQTIPEAIRSAAHQYSTTAVHFNGTVNPAITSIGELFDDGCRVASSLADLGIQPGDVVAVQLPNWRECIVAHAAAWLCGAVVLPIVPIYGPHEVAFILQRSAARAFITTRMLGKRDATATVEAAQELSSLDHCIIVGEPIPGTVSFETLSRNSSTEFSEPGGTPKDHERCLLVYTSGTTAEPKGVQHTHKSVLGEMRAMEQIRGLGASIPSLAVFPSGHIAGTLGILRLLTQERMTVVMDGWNPETAAHLIARHKIGMSAGAPIHLSGILDVGERDRLDFSSLQEYTTGAANVAGDLIRRADKLGICAFRCYGSSEHPTISSGVSGDPLDKRADTDGRLTPGTEIRLVDDDGQEVENGCEGEILSRGPELFSGYSDAALTRLSIVDGWFRTGDIGRVDADGFLTITDRKKDIIVRGGENISSKEVEDALGGHPSISEVAAIGAPDDKYGERVCAFVVLNPGHQFGVAEAAEHFRECGLARQKTPERIVVVDELPRTASGKVQKHLLRDRLS